MKSMKKLSLILAVLLTISCVFAGCGKNQDSANASQNASETEFTPITFTDSTGVEITLNSRPRKVAVLFSSYADMWNLAGGEISVTVADSITRGFVSESDVTLVDDGSGIEIDTEALVASKPDLVIGSADMSAQVEACEFCNSVGIPAALFKVEDIDDYLDVLRICTDITGNAEAYQTNGVEVKAEVDRIKRKIEEYTADKESAKILFVRAGSTSKSTKAKTADDNFAAQMLKELGTYNIAENASVLLDGLSLEEIVAENPEYIFISIQGSESAGKKYIEELFGSDGWKNLDAVKNSKYIFLPKDLFHYKPNAKWAEAYKYAANILYPELNLDE